MNVYELEEYLIKLLSIDKIKDYSINGLQVACSDKRIKKICYAVDCGTDTIIEAIRQGADAIICHHGLLWDNRGSKRITKANYEKVRLLIDSDIALIGIHLPLDSNQDVGNNIYLANKLKYKNIQRASFDADKIGFLLEVDESFDDILATISTDTEFANGKIYHRKGKNRIKTVYVVSGNGSKLCDDVIQSGVDLFITGEFGHQNYLSVVESELSVIALGHYLSEMGGVKMLYQKIVQDLKIEGEFLYLPTGF